MTLPGVGFGLRVQGPNVQRMVVSALASTVSFVMLGRKCPSLVLNWHVLRLFCPVRASLRRGPSVIVISGIILGDFGKNFRRGNSNSWPIECPLICIILVVILLTGARFVDYFGRNLDFLEKSFPPGRLR